ncbi:MAG: SPFH domain-containing protein [Proteobacteria bacterium]|nr:SPFH domain-containing protein [Pseudomonadota bacterium]
MVWGAIKNQLRSVIEWEGAENSLFENWSTNADEIKNASKLILKPGQGCIFLYQGKMEAVWTEPKLYELKTDNIPFWTTVSKFMQAFQSEHKVGIYFFRTAEMANIKWGTPNPISYEDPKFKLQVKLKCHGTFSAKILEPAAFMANIVMSRAKYTTEEFKELILGRVLAPMGDFLAESQFSYSEVDKNRNEIASGLKASMDEIFAKLGFAMTDFRINGTGFDEKTEKAIEAINSAHVDAQVAAARGMTYFQEQQLKIMQTAAANEGGGMVGTGVGLGAGVALGQNMASTFAGMMGGMQAQPPQQGQANQQAGAAPVAAAEDPVARLQKLKGLMDSGIISKEEFEEKKKEILSKI